jgi:fatty-acyl-CoA synthase
MYQGDWTERLAQLFGEREAIVDVDDKGEVRQRITYDELRMRVAATATALVELGVTQGVRVAIIAKNRVEHLELMFACARLGALFLPVNWRLAAPEVHYILGDATPGVVVVEPAFMSLVAGWSPPDTGAGGPIVVDVDSFARSVAACRARGAGHVPPQAPVSTDDAWIILYTSGTTGHPKGALLPYRQVAFNALNTIVALDLASTDKTVTYTPLFHTGGLHVLTTPMFAHGGCIVLCDGFDADRVLELTARENCTVLFGVPTTYERMAESALFKSGRGLAVRLALCGGAPCPRSLIDTWNQRGVVFKQGYGLTECGPNVLNLNAADVVRKAGAAGRPNLTITAVVVDDEGRVVRGAGRGELCLGGPCVCLGYWNKPDQTKASFTTGEHGVPAGLLKTGDVVEIDDEGYMTIVDRKKDMFISGGENVYPAEVEKVLSDHPRVRAAAVIGIPSAQWGEVGRAYVESKDAGSAVDVDDLLAFARARLARYKVPKEVVVVDALPRNPSGKVQKHLLAR